MDLIHAKDIAKANLLGMDSKVTGEFLMLEVEKKLKYQN